MLIINTKDSCRVLTGYSLECILKSLYFFNNRQDDFLGSDLKLSDSLATHDLIILCDKSQVKYKIDRDGRKILRQLTNYLEWERYPASLSLNKAKKVEEEHGPPIDENTFNFVDGLYSSAMRETLDKTYSQFNFINDQKN